MTSKRIAQFNQQHKRKASQESGTLQRAAVRSVSEAGVQSTDDLEAQPLGNSAFSKDFSRVPISTTKPQQIMAKLMIGEPGDKYEQEADETARQVVQRIHQPQSEKLQREPLPEKEDELQMKPMVQRVSDGGMPASPDLETSIQQARGSGQPLADSIKSPMEQAFGADFSGVKVHTDTQADQLNQSIQAKAFTSGHDVFFRQGEYQPGSRGGQELLAHELTHVLQQNSDTVQCRIIQRAVDTMGGSWEANNYQSVLEKGNPGAEIELEFMPNKLVNSKKIALLQKIEKIQNGINFDRIYADKKNNNKEIVGNAAKTAASRTEGNGHWDRCTHLYQSGLWCPEFEARRASIENTQKQIGHELYDILRQDV